MIETLIRINVPYSETSQYLPYGDGVYFSKLTMDFKEYGPYYSQWGNDDINRRRIIIDSVAISNETFTRKSTLLECMGDDKSFFWDNVTQILYIHFEAVDTPESSSIVTGIRSGYSYIGTEESIYIDDIEYQPRISTLPNIKKKVDKFEAGKMTFQDQTISLHNGDGALDDFIQNPIPGSEGSIVLYDTEEDTELEYYTGFVSFDSSTYDTFKIKLIDKRRRENIKVPNTLFDDTTWPDIESKYVGDIIPEGYGVQNRIECFPVNGTVSSGNIKYKYATDATVLTSVEVKEDDVWTDVTASVLNSAPSTGYFELPYASATNASGGLLDCVCTATLRADVNPGDIIEDMNDRYNSVTYDATNYNTTEWASEKAKLADVSLYMEKSQEYFKWIEALQNGSDYWFVYDIDGDGKRTLRVNDPNRTLIRSIEYNEIKDDKKQVERDFEQLSSTVAVLYNQDIESETFDRIDVDTYEEDVLAKYSYNENSEYECLLTDSDDAQFKADLIAEDQSEARAIVEVTLHETGITGIGLKLYDIVTVDTAKPDTTYWHDVSDDIYFDYTATDDTYFDYEADDSVYFFYGETINNGDGRPYYGTIRGQVIGIAYNPTNLSYTLTVRERPVSEVI